MPSYSQRSKARLATCHENIQRVMNKVIEDFDCTILCGHRSKDEQDAAFNVGKSKVKWPHGKHNKKPSEAVDVIPYPINWGDRERMSYFAGQVVATGRSMGITLRWGGDWDRDTEVADNSFDDLVHFELVNK